MKTENRYTFLHMIYDELEKAEKKHPKLCDAMTDVTIEQYRELEDSIKKANSHAPYYGDDILSEEFNEAFVAYLEGDKDHCLQELAQCGAVILRLMDFVKEEK